MSAPANAELVDQIRQVIDDAREAGQPPPGRPTLAKLTGTSEYKVRLALAELASAEDRSDDQFASDGDTGDSPAPVATPNPSDGTSAPVEAAGIAGATDAGLSELVSVGVHAGVRSTAPEVAGAKVVSWAGFVFGSVMSVAANVIHTWLPAPRMPPGWAPGIAAQIGAAVWPIGLLLSVEVLSRVQWPAGWAWRFARFGGTGIVAIGSAVISYGHVHDVLAAWGYDPLAAHVGPLVLDGLMVISGFALLTTSRSRTRTADEADRDG
ncbi:DUF2637 domain-containing protein [Amycolatopsis sp. lyj-108]|uniref:DUF2637 domain-containing protein n=1 Tax=Amycolatopsis sp. lyj-108 TaxID=2789286 RepID=UPI00397AB027